MAAMSDDELRAHREFREAWFTKRVRENPGMHIVTVRHDAEVLAALDKRVCMNYTPLVGGGKPKRSTSDDSKTASRDPAAVRAPHPDIWRLWLPPMPSPGS